MPTHLVIFFQSVPHQTKQDSQDNLNTLAPTLTLAVQQRELRLVHLAARSLNQSTEVQTEMYTVKQKKFLSSFANFQIAILLRDVCL